MSRFQNENCVLRKAGMMTQILSRKLPVAFAVFLMAAAQGTSCWAQTKPGLMAPSSPNVAERTPAGQMPVGEQIPGYKLGSGDQVQITVFGENDLTGKYLVDGSGMLSFPLIGQVKAGGMTANELENAIVSRLKPNYLRDPKVSVEVLTYRPFYIMGEVMKPGSYAYVSGMSVVNAVALAGGFTYRARDDSFYLTRTEKDGKKVKIDAAPETPVEPGDVITVRERFF